MKKKLFLISLLAVLFVCVFAITSNADIIALDTDPGLDCDSSLVSSIDIDAYTNSTVTDKESKIVLTDGTKFYVFPAYYMVSNSSSYNANSFSTLKSAAAGQGVTLNSAKECLVRIQIPTYVAEINQRVGKFEYYTKLKEARFGTHLVKIEAQNAFTGCSSLEYVSDISHMTQINNATFTGCSNLKIDINWPAAVTSINNQMFEGSGITSITIPEGVTALGQRIFYQCPNITEVILPNTVTSVGKMAFASCANLETVNFGASFTTFTSPNNDYETFLSTTSIKYVYVPSTFANNLTGSKGFYNIFNQGKNVTFFFAGTYDEAVAAQNKFIAATANANVSTAELVAYDPTVNYEGYADSLGKNLIVYNYSECDAFYNGVHTYVANPCVEICSVCEDIKALENPNHTLKTEITYTNYTVAGEKHIYCTNDGCSKDEKLVAPALFEFVGYSTNEEGTELCVGYAINLKAIEEYNLANGKMIAYGVVATIIDEGEALSLSYENSEVKSNLDKTVVATIDREYQGVDFKISGFKNYEEGDSIDLKSLNLVMCAYAYDGEFYFIGSANEENYCKKNADTVTFAQIEGTTTE